MTIPIRNTLFNQNYNFENSNNYFTKNKYFSLNFDEKNLNNFKIIKTGYKILNSSHASWILFVVLNDFLVKKFLNKEIFFYQIVNNLIKIFNNKNTKSNIKKKINNLSDIKKMISLCKNLKFDYD